MSKFKRSQHLKVYGVDVFFIKFQHAACKFDAIEAIQNYCNQNQDYINSAYRSPFAYLKNRFNLNVVNGQGSYITTKKINNGTRNFK
jgi:hypothetical protein